MNILIAEDENRTRSRIAKTIKRYKNIDNVFEAADGLEALEIIRQKEIDILITDICMPRMTGLELIKSMKSEGMDPETVVMSGYNDFEYARQAISYDVREYLLKPVDPEELERLLEKLYARITQKRYQESSMRNPFFNRLISGTDTGMKELLREMETLRLPTDASLYVLAFVTMEDGDIGDEAAVMTTISEVAADLPAEMSAYPFPCHMLSPAILFMFANSTEKTAIKLITKFADILSDRNGKENGYRLFLGCSRPKASLSSLHEARDEALLVARLETEFVESVRFFFPEIKTDGARTSEQEEQAIISRLLSVDSLDDDAEDQLVKDFIMLLKARAGISFSEVTDMLHMFTFRLFERITDDVNLNERQKIAAMADALKLAKTVNDAGRRMHMLIRELRIIYSLKALSPGDIICRNVKNRIEENISNSFFSVQDAIEGLNYSENYIRYIFTNHYGMSIKEYLIKERMEKAKELLLKGLQVKKIAELTGYENQRYFASCFKDYTGRTPTEWREEMTKTQ